MKSAALAVAALAPEKQGSGTGVPVSGKIAPASTPDPPPMENFAKLLEIVRRKAVYDRNNPWYHGPESYLNGLKDEVDEVIEEIARQRSCHLEDELGDLLWNTLNAVVALEKTHGVRLEAVLERAGRKFGERLAGLEAGRSWQAIKDEQKQALEREQAARSGD